MTHLDEAILAQAAHWFVRIHSENATPDDFVEWQQWLARDERHLATFHQIEDFWTASHRIPAPPWPTPEELARGRSEERRSRFLASAALAAALTIFAWLLLTLNRDPGIGDRAIIATRSAEHRDLILTDGTSLALGAESQVRVEYSPATRHVALAHGEAFFTVIRDASRPFIVHVGTGTITAVGTAFNVQNITLSPRVARVSVAVTEGTVAVVDATGTTTTAIAGDRINYDTGPGSRPAHRENFTGTASPEARAATIAAATAWREGCLTYLGEPLGFVIADVSRYTDKEIILEAGLAAAGDPSIADLRYTGTVLATDIDDWLDSLSTIFPLRIARKPDGSIVITPAVAPAAEASPASHSP